MIQDTPKDTPKHSGAGGRDGWHSGSVDWSRFLGKVSPLWKKKRGIEIPLDQTSHQLVA